MTVGAIQQTEMKEKISKLYLRRKRKLLKINLCSKNYIKEINTCVVFQVIYSRLFLKWTLKEPRQVEKKDNKIIDDANTLHLSDNIDRLSRNEGRRLATFDDCVDESIQQLEDWITNSKETPLATSCNTVEKSGTNIKITNTRKQKWEEKRLVLVRYWLNRPRENLDMIKRRKHFERNWNTFNRKTKQRHKDQLYYSENLSYAGELQVSVMWRKRWNHTICEWTRLGGKADS